MIDSTEMETKKQTFQRVAIAAHSSLDAALGEAKRIAEFLHANGLQAEHFLFDDEEFRQRLKKGEYDLLVTLGGDGTVLRAGHLCAPCDIPILAINWGRFGFLIEVTRDRWEAMLQKLIEGDYWLEKRMMLRVEQWRGNEHLGRWDVLNEALVGRGAIARPVHLVTRLDGRPLTTYVADGLIVATPTGSTAYALAAGGPILPPELRNILLLPVAPHLSVDRAIVVAEGSMVSVTIRSSHQAVLSADGHYTVELQDNDRVEVCASEYTVTFVRFQDPGYFYRNLIALMGQNPTAGELS